MRICHIITRFVRGGADENTLLTCNGQAEHGHDVTIIYGADSHEYMLERAHPNVKLISAPRLVRSVSIGDIPAMFELRRLLQELSPDIVHTHTSKAGVLGRFAAKMVGVPIIIHGVHILSFDNVGTPVRQIYLVLERWAARYTDGFIHVSEGMREQCFQSNVGLDKKHFVVPSGMDVNMFKHVRRPTDLRSLLPANIAKSVSENTKYLVMAGALEKRKRTEEFLSVFARIAQRVPDCVLLIAGDGPRRHDIEKKIERLKLSSRAACVGFMEEFHKLIGLADICVHAASREGLPRVVIQYVMAGKPVVAAELPGIDVLIKSGKTGLLVDTDELEHMEEAIVGLLKSPETRKAYAENARLIDFSAWDSDEMVNRIEKIYEEIRLDKNYSAHNEKNTPSASRANTCVKTTG